MFKTATYIIFSVLFLALTVGVNISKHYSNGKLYSQSIFGKAESCMSGENDVCMMKDMPGSCKMHQKQNKTNHSKPSCSCKDTSEYLHFYAIYIVPEKISINIVSEKVITLFSNIIFINYNNPLLNPQFNISDNGTSPPNILNTLSLFQVFRC